LTSKNVLAGKKLSLRPDKGKMREKNSTGRPERGPKQGPKKKEGVDSENIDAQNRGIGGNNEKLLLTKKKNLGNHGGVLWDPLRRSRQKLSRVQKSRIFEGRGLVGEIKDGWTNKRGRSTA